MFDKVLKVLGWLSRYVIAWPMYLGDPVLDQLFKKMCYSRDKNIKAGATLLYYVLVLSMVTVQVFYLIMLIGFPIYLLTD